MRTTPFVFLLAIVLSCDSLSNDFFEVLLNTYQPELTRVCAHNPSIFSNGRFIEQYEMSAGTEANFLARFSVSHGDSLDFPRSGAHYFERYREDLTWRKTPVKNEDSIVLQIASDVGDEALECYDVEDVMRLLKTKGNYYTFIYETFGTVLGGYKFYLLEPASHRLYVLTSFQ
ncbi:hypothetical protein KK062_22840 [Fulvivirgaceae bacterium PWU5]|uniref:Uncharacterized protein n=1 Tax=Dawidia cretensis TaxID=2782350 RepID=A0AAP2E100_9BACT|nr:hypothetical protein [Dawidia cretensis]MBT1711098.1 hypothetical protein [Dawidia cretensis]